MQNSNATFNAPFGRTPVELTDRQTAYQKQKKNYDKVLTLTSIHTVVQYVVLVSGRMKSLNKLILQLGYLMLHTERKENITHLMHIRDV